MESSPSKGVVPELRIGIIIHASDCYSRGSHSSQQLFLIPRCTSRHNIALL
jgi:hypothetical protein